MWLQIELHNYPENKDIREIFVYYTVSVEYTTHGEQTVLLINSLENYLLSMTKQSKKESLYSNWNQSQMKEFIVKVVTLQIIIYLSSCKRKS